MNALRKPETDWQWYCIMTSPRMEDFAADALKRQGFEVLNLHYYEKKMRRLSNGRTVVSTKRRPYFRGYLFVTAPPNTSFYALKTTEGVSTMLYGPDGPRRVRGHEMATLLTLCDPQGCVGQFEKKDDRAKFKSGQRLKILNGPFQSLHAKVVEDKGKTVYLDIDGLNGGVSIAAAALEAIPA